MTKNVIVTRIERLLEVKGISQNEASRRAGTGLGMTRDLLSGRTESPRVSTVESLAHALEVSPMYLLGYIDTYWPSQSGGARVNIVHSLAVNRWVEQGVNSAAGHIIFGQDSRFPSELYCGYRVDDSHCNEVVAQGSVAVGIPVESFNREITEGQIVLIERLGADNLVERTLRRIDIINGMNALIALSAIGEPIRMDDVNITAVIIGARAQFIV